MSAAPHPLLYISELVTAICYHVQEDSSLSKLARTSSIFCEPALDLLWKEQSSLVALVHTMPPSLFAEKRPRIVEGFFRPLEPDDFPRLHYYAKRVRSLNIDDENLLFGGVAVNVVLELFLGCSESCLLPNIQSLQISLNLLPDNFSMAILLPFLGPKMKTLDIKFDEEMPQLPTFLYHLHKRCPDVANFTISVNEDTPELHRALSTALCHWNGLRKVDVEGPLTYDALLHLSNLETLEELDWSGDTNDTFPDIPSETPLFPNLTKVSLFGSLKLCEHFTTVLSHCPLTRVFMYIHLKTGLFPHHTRSSIYSSLGSHDTLVEIELRETLEADLEEVDYATLTLTDLEPFLRLSGLKKLDLGSNAKFVFSDNDVRRMGESWRYIERLQFSHNTLGSAFETPNIHVTLSGLALMVKLCPKLTNLSIPFDGNTVPETEPTAPGRRLKYLGVKDCPLSELSAEKTGRFLSKLFPSLGTLGLSFAYDESDSWGKAYKVLTECKKSNSKAESRLCSDSDSESTSSSY